MPLWKEYLQPSTVKGALDALSESKAPAALIAGGTDLLLDLAQGRHAPVDVLIDVTRIDEMRGIREEDDHIFLGAAVTHRDIVGSALLKEHATCLVEACGMIGGSQIRNVATLGGNVGHALPAADGTIALLALDAYAQLATPGARQWQPVADLFMAPGKTSFDRNQTILVQFRLPKLRSREASAFQRIMQPQGIAIAILNMAVWLSESNDGPINDIRLSVGPGGPYPFRAIRTEEFLKGRGLAQETLEHSLAVLLEEVHLRTSPHRATEMYRQHLAGVLLERTLSAAHERMREG